jgi:hypothetical protein
MASGSSADHSNGSELSAAQKLMQKHAESTPHPVTVEDVPDVDLPKPSSNEATGSWAAPISSAANGNQKENKSLDTQSHELFPELGAPKGKAANVAPIWGAKSNAGTKPNGSGSNGASRSSTPATATPTPARGATPPAMTIPGRNVESVTLEPSFVKKRDQLRRPMTDIIRDLNRKSRANITMSTASNGRLKFDATGPQDVAQQALKDLVAEIGTRVRNLDTIPK